MVEAHSTIDRGLKASKDGQFIVIPLVKTHIFNNSEFNTVDFCHLNTQTLQLYEYKYRTNIHQKISYSWDLSPTLTARHLPYLFLLKGPML